jgi:hypothetical protein
VEPLLVQGRGAAAVTPEARAGARAALAWAEQLAEAQGEEANAPSRPQFHGPNIGLSPADYVLQAAHYILGEVLPRDRVFEPRGMQEAYWPSVAVASAREYARRAAAGQAAGPAPPNAGPPWHDAWMAGHAAEAAAQAALLRCICGNPFGPPPAIEPTQLAWSQGTVRKVAEAIYADRAFELLGVLADALEEAGCSDAQVLAHLRSGSGHDRGCHVLDAILGRS